jgi:ParB family chromosome partitioning protein
MKMKQERKALGKGLSALITNTAQHKAEQPRLTGLAANTDEGDQIQMLALSDIFPNPNQPRKTFSQEELYELADSISEHGVVSPILVRVKDQGYEIIAGERRWQAAKIAGLTEIPAIIRDLDDQQTMEVAIVENIQRQDLNPAEEAESYYTLLTNFGYTQAVLAKKLGKSRSYLANMARLAELPSEVKELLRDGKITAGHARALLTSKSAPQIAQRIVIEGLNVRDVENLVRRENSPVRAVSNRSPKINSIAPNENMSPEETTDPELLSLAQNLSEQLGTKVTINSNRLILHYDDFEKLDEWIGLLSKTRL